MNRPLVRIPLLFLLVTLPPSFHGWAGESPSHTLMPVPEFYEIGEGGFPLDSSFVAVLKEYREPRLERACRRLEARVARHAGMIVTPSSAAPGGGCALEVYVSGGAREFPGLDDDESYSLRVTRTSARLDAPSPYGALRGMETFIQLIEPAGDQFHVRAATVRDRPRFPWRGLLIDVCRHWIPPDAVKRILDGMAAVKMNVLHWHLSDDQGFRVESKRFPNLHSLGSDGLFLTQDDVRDMVAYAADRGIRVVPEFDMPGHTTAWLVGYPHLASAPGPYSIERRWGIQDPTLDPTRDAVYSFLDSLLGEMVPLFPDGFFHIGGDEVTGKHWDANPAISRFREREGLKDYHDLQAYFNRRLHALVRRHGKIMMGWDEILHPDLPKDIVIQSWRGQAALATSASGGYRGILSYGYYLDHMLPATFHYLIDPLAGEAADITPDARKRVLGGEACMWTELVTAENIESRVWPRAAAIAERLWSPSTVNDTTDMERRMTATSARLERDGALHRVLPRLMIERMAGSASAEPLKVLAESVEPLQLYERHHLRTFTSFTPMNRLPDVVAAESRPARRLSLLVSEFVADPGRAAHGEEIRALLTRWRDNHARVVEILPHILTPAEIAQVSLQLHELAVLGLRAVDAITSGRTLDSSAGDTAILDRAAAPAAEVVCAVLPAVRLLVETARDDVRH